MIKEFLENQRPLIVAGLLNIILFVVLAIISMFDAEEILGINRWIKPMKFAVSIGIYLWTLAVYLFFINGAAYAKSLISWGSLLMLTGEIVLIVMQAARGTTSHFNVQQGSFNALVFSVMGIMILINTLLVGYLLVLYFRAEINLPQSLVWGMRFGIILLLLASAEGGLMSAILRHSIGTADGGPGLPFVNWSTKGGDLRVAHFLGMHAFQAIPLFAYTLERYGARSATSLTIIFAVFYFALFTAAFIQAMLGLPLFAGL